MAKYIIKRLLQSVLTILLVVSIVFLLLRLMPTDYFFSEEELIKLTDEQRHDKLQAAGLLEQLGRFYKQMLTDFDLGVSRKLQAGQPVAKLIGQKFGISMKLGLIALGISLVLGVVFGVLQARYKDGLFENPGLPPSCLSSAWPSAPSPAICCGRGGIWWMN